MLHHMALVRTDVSEERIVSVIRVTRCDLVFVYSLLRLLVTANVVPSSPFLSLMMDAICSSKMSVLTRATRRNIPEDNILQCSLWYEMIYYSGIFHFSHAL
jgi:hypothetical protein